MERRIDENLVLFLAFTAILQIFVSTWSGVLMAIGIVYLYFTNKDDIKSLKMKISLFLSILSLLIAILFMGADYFVASSLDYVDENKDIISGSDIDAALNVCIEGSNNVEKSFCYFSLLDAHKQNSRVISGDMCLSLEEGFDKSLCVMFLGLILEDVTKCDLLSDIENRNECYEGYTQNIEKLKNIN